jgi:hypothetical protein
MLTGKRPIDAEDTMQLLAAVLEHPPITLAQATGLPFPAPLEAFIAKSLEKDPNRRFQTAIEMRDALVEAGKAIGYESTGPLSVPAQSTEPSGVVPRVPAKTQMGVGGQPPPPAAAKQTMMGIGGANNHNGPPPPAMQAPPPPSMQSSFGPQSEAPMTMPAPLPSSLPMAPPVQNDPFGPMPGGLAPPPMADFGPTSFNAPAATPAAAEPAKPKSKAGLVVLLAAVGLVALGGAGALVARSMNQRTVSPGASRVTDVTPGNAQGAIGSAPSVAQPAAQPAAQPTAQPAAVPAAQPTVGSPTPESVPSQATATGPAAQPPAQPAANPTPAPNPTPAASPEPAANPAPSQNTQRAAASEPTARVRPAATNTAPATTPTARTRPVSTAGTSSNPFDPAPTPRTQPVAPARTPTPTPTPTPRTTPRRNTPRGTTSAVPF